MGVNMFHFQMCIAIGTYRYHLTLQNLYATITQKHAVKRLTANILDGGSLC